MATTPLAAWANSPAGTVISNTARAVVTTAAGASSSNTSNTVTSTVGEVLDVGAASQVKVSVKGGDTAVALGFTVTNLGTGSEAMSLAANAAAPGRSFSPTLKQITLDSDGDGKLTASDTLYQPGVNDPVLAPGKSIMVWVVCDMPPSMTAGGSAPVSLTASAMTGTGSPGQVFAAKGDGGSDAVVGKTGASATAQSAYVASSLGVGLSKSQSASVAHPTAGSLITYTLQASFTGAGTASGAAVADPIPAGATYVPGTLRLDGATLTDAADGDPGRVDTNGVLVALGDVAAPAQHVVTFQVRINTSNGSPQ